MIEPIALNEIFEMAKDRQGQHPNRAAAVAVLRANLNEFVKTALTILSGGQGINNLRHLKKTTNKLAHGVRNCDEACEWAITQLVQ